MARPLLSVGVLFTFGVCCDAYTLAVNSRGEIEQTSRRPYVRQAVHPSALAAAGKDALPNTHPGFPAEMLENSLQIAAQAAAAANVSYFLIYGSALGIYREHGVVDRDDDIDIAVPEDKLEDVKMALRAMKPGLNGYLNAMHESFNISEFGCWHSGFLVQPLTLHITFWGYTLSKSGEHVCFGVPAGCPKTKWRDAYPTNMTLPPQFLPVRSTKYLTISQLPVPRDTEHHLELNYGPDFRTAKARNATGAKTPLEGKQARFDAFC